jgi:hypothetical protein
MHATATIRRRDLRPQRARSSARPLYSVGRSQPNDELATLDREIELLRDDLARHEPAAGDTQELANWATLTHRLNGFLLRWGQFKGRLSEDWWWGDDDEVALATMKNEYNGIRSDVLSFTSVKPVAEEVDPVPPDLRPDPPTSPVVQSLRLVALIAGLAVGGYVLLMLLPVWRAGRGAKALPAAVSEAEVGP